MTINRARIALRVLPRYPSNITAGEGIKVTKTPSAVTVAQNVNSLAELPDPSLPGAYALVFADGSHWKTLLSKQANSLYDTRAAAVLASIAPAVNYVRTFGYTTVGDGGGALYKRVIAAPSHQGYFQSADGAFWELVDLPATPEMFGAKRDGITDDAAAINNAIAYVNARGGGVVQLLPGTYRVHSMIALLSGVTLRGSGLRKSGLTIPSTWAIGSIIQASGQSLVAVEGLFVVGNFSGTDNDNAGIRFFNVTTGRIIDNEISNTSGDGILVNGAEGLATQNVLVQGNTCVGNRNGISFFKFCLDCAADDNDIETSRLNGIMVDDATTADDPLDPDPLKHPAPCFRTKLSRNNIMFPSQSGSNAGIVVSGSVDTIISDNSILDGGVNTGVVGTSKTCVGIIINSGQEFFNAAINTIIKGNTIERMVGGGAVQMKGAWQGLIVGNVFDNCFLWPDPLSGTLVVILDDDPAGKHTRDVIVDGNTFIGNGQTTQACQFAPSVTGCIYGANRTIGIGVDLQNNVPGSNFAQVVGVGPLPTANVRYQHRLWLSTTDGKLYVGTGVPTWVVVGTQT